MTKHFDEYTDREHVLEREQYLLAEIGELGAALKAQAGRIVRDKSHIEMLERAAEKLLGERDELRAQLAALQVPGLEDRV